MLLAQVAPNVSYAAYWSIVAALIVGGVLLVCLGVLVVLLMVRTNRLSRALAATADAELRTKLLQQSHWWPRFGFRTMLVVVTFVAVGLGLFMMELNRARRQADIIDSLVGRDFLVTTNYRLGIFGNGMIAKLFCHWVHPDFGCTITGLVIDTNAYSGEAGYSLLTDDDFARITTFDSLETLAIDSVDLLPKGFASLASLTRLKRLSVGGCRLDDDDFEQLSQIKSLELLRLHGTKLTGKTVTPLGKLPKLEVLVLCDNYFSQADLAALGQINNVETIVIDETPVSFAHRDELPANVRLRTYLKTIRTN